MMNADQETPFKHKYRCFVRFISRARIAGILIPLLMVCFGFIPLARADRPRAGYVYVMTNQPAGNTVIQYQRARNGHLTMLDEVATGGLGSAGAVDPLASQDALAANGNGSLLLAVNAGSDELSSLVVNGGFHMASIVPSGGDFPNSVALHDDLVYVLNAHGTPNISGFTVDMDGMLTAIPGSTVNLPGGAAADPHDIRFSPDGSRLLVTEGGTNQIDIFDIGEDGTVTNTTTQPTAGMVPFGFVFTRGHVVVVTEAASAAASTYRLTNDDMLQPISSVVQNGQAATCWIAITRVGHTFVSNTPSANLSSYQTAASGILNLLHPIAASQPGSAPIDMALSRDNRSLYVEDSANGKVLIYRVSGTTLRHAGSVNGLPTSLQGIVAR
jgi:6-phosphogluconolactonase